MGCFKSRSIHTDTLPKEESKTVIEERTIREAIVVDQVAANQEGSKRVKDSEELKEVKEVKEERGGQEISEVKVEERKRKGSDVESEDEEPQISKEERERREKELLERKMKMNKKQRVSISAESYGIFNKMNTNLRVIEKTTQQKELIREKMLKSFLFKAMDERNFTIIIDAMEEYNFKAGESIITQGEPGSILFLIDLGEADVFRKGNEEEEAEGKLVRTLQSGDTFGEIALLYNSPRTATVKAKTDCKLWGLDRATFSYIVKETTMKKRELYESFLKSVKILSYIESYDLGLLCDSLKQLKVPAGDLIIKQGDQGKEFFILEEGTATVSFDKKPEEEDATTRKEVTSGSYFGEIALIKDVPRTANVTAKTDCRLISLDRNTFKRLLGPIEEILNKNSVDYDNLF